MKARVWVVTAITAASLALVLWGADPERIRAAVADVPLWVVVPVEGLFFAILLLRTARFALVLDDRVGFGDLLAVVAVSFLAVNVVPLRMGELARPYLLNVAHGVSLGSAFAALVAERLCDLLALVLALLAVGVLLPPAGVVEVGGVDVFAVGLRAMGALASSVAALAVVAAALGPERLEGLAGAFGPRAAPVARMAARFSVGLRALSARPVRALGALLCTAGMWALTLAAVALLLRAFGIAPSFGLVFFDWTATLTALSLVPTPGFVGPFEAGAAGGLVVAGVDADRARAFAIVLHTLMFGFHAAAGLAFAARHGWSVREVLRRSRAP